MGYIRTDYDTKFSELILKLKFQEAIKLSLEKLESTNSKIERSCTWMLIASCYLVLGVEEYMKNKARSKKKVATYHKDTIRAYQNSLLEYPNNYWARLGYARLTLEFDPKKSVALLRDADRTTIIACLRGESRSTENTKLAKFNKQISFIQHEILCITGVAKAILSEQEESEKILSRAYGKKFSDVLDTPDLNSLSYLNTHQVTLAPRFAKKLIAKISNWNKVDPKVLHKLFAIQ